MGVLRGLTFGVTGVLGCAVLLALYLGLKVLLAWLVFVVLAHFGVAHTPDFIIAVVVGIFAP